MSCLSVTTYVLFVLISSPRFFPFSTRRTSLPVCLTSFPVSLHPVRFTSFPVSVHPVRLTSFPVSLHPVHLTSFPVSLHEPVSVNTRRPFHLVSSISFCSAPPLCPDPVGMSCGSYHLLSTPPPSSGRSGHLFFFFLLRVLCFSGRGGRVNFLWLGRLRSWMPALFAYCLLALLASDDGARSGGSHESGMAGRLVWWQM